MSMADSAASGGSSETFRQLATLVGVAFAAGAATAAASYWLLQAGGRQRLPEPDSRQCGLNAASAAPAGAASAQPQQQQQQQQPSGRKRRPAPPPLRSPFQDDKRCGGTGDASDASVDRCWEWLSQSEDGIQVPGPMDPPLQQGIPASQALRRHRQEEQRRRDQQQQQHADARRRRSADASRLPSETVSDPLGISTPPQNERRSGSLPSLPADLLPVEHATSAPLPENIPAPAEASLLRPATAAGDSGAPAGSAFGTLDCIAEDSGDGGGGSGGGGSRTRPVSWGPSIRNMQQPAALNTSPSGSMDLHCLHPTPQRTVAEALTSAAMQQSSVRVPSSGSDEAKGTVALDELRLCHRHDGQPFILGKGNFGTVYKAMLRDELVAVKVFPVGNRAKGEENFRKEITLLRKCANEHIVAFRAACLDAPGNLLMAMELMKCDLHSALHEQADGALLWYSRNSNGRRTPGLGKQIALDIARGLQFLHERHIVHLDLKTPNVLLTEDNEAKISDVGLARFMPNDYMSAQAAIGAFVWSAPEVLMGAKCSEKVDIYSYGVILWELVTGESPQRGRMRSIRVPEECPAGVADLVTACMERDPAIRPSAADIVELLSGDPAALQRRLDAHASTDSVCGDSAEEPITDDDRVRLQQLYNQCNYTIWQGPEAAAAAGYSEPPLESVVEGIRPFDGKSYSEMIRQLKELLESPDIEDTSSAPRRRLEELISVFRPLYATKLKMSTRVFQELKHTDVNRLGELVDSSLLCQQADDGAAGSGGGGGGSGNPEAVEHAAASAADPPATSAEAPAHADARSRDSKGSSSSGGKTGHHSGGAIGSSGVDEYAADKDPARRAPPDAALWNRVLDAMRLTPAQLEALAEARLRVGVRLQHLHSERSALVAKLQALSDAQDVEMYEQAAAAATELRTNMRLEGQANHLFQVYVMVDLLDAIQYARGECCAWPAMLDAAEVGTVALQRCRQGVSRSP